MIQTYFGFDDQKAAELWRCAAIMDIKSYCMRYKISIAEFATQFGVREDAINFASDKLLPMTIQEVRSLAYRTSGGIFYVKGLRRRKTRIK